MCYLALYKETIAVWFEANMNILCRQNVSFLTLKLFTRSYQQESTAGVILSPA